MTPLDGKKGWEIRFCLECGYAIEKCTLTRYFNYCPLCQKRRNIQVRLVDRFVVHVPENKVLIPLPGGKGLEQGWED